MRGVVLTVKALVMVFLVISISFVSQSSFVSAEGSGNVCCEETVDGDSCVYTSEDHCAEDSIQGSISCEQTAFCKAGCCVSDLGQCSKGVAQATCESIEGYTWQEGSDCAIESCQKNCCVIAESQCAYTTEAYCEHLIVDLEDIVLDWREVDSESSCTEICKASTKGCCASEDSCIYGTKAECENPTIDLSSGYGFYEESYCSEIGSCGCTAGDSYACIDEDVYSFDACGNQEGIAEDCDYTQGEWCGTNAQGEAECLSTDCDDIRPYPGTEDGTSFSTFPGYYYINSENPGDPKDLGEGIDRNPHDLRIGGNRQNGESWCLYESPAGGFKDFPGSQHYRSFCYFGEEIIEPCADFREEVCIQVPYDVYRGVDEYGLWSKEYEDPSEYEGPTGSACVDNMDNEIFNPNTTTVSVGALWDDDSLAGTCAVANVECKMSYAKDSWTDPTFQASQGVACTSPQTVKVSHEYCRSMGDCGAATNLVGQFSNAGFYRTSSHEFLTAYDDGNKSHRVYVGYDSCVDHYIVEDKLLGLGSAIYVGDDDSDDDGVEAGNSNDFEKNQYYNQIDTVNNRLQEAVYCLYDCNTEAGDGNTPTYGDCTFISHISEEELYSYYDGGENSEYYQKPYVFNEDEKVIISGGFPSWSLEEDLGQKSYGVYGGLVAISQVMANSELGTIQANLGWTIGLATVSIAGAAITAGVLLVAGGGGAVAGSTATLGTAFAAAAGVAGATVAIVVAAIAIIVLTLASWAQVSDTVNPEERQQATNTLAITSTVAAGLSVILLAIALAASTGGPVGWIVSLVALIVAAFVAIISYGGEVREVTINSHCEAWQPPTGSDYCELCDIPVSEGGLAIDDGEGNVLTGWDCTEYKCKSLGVGCAYISENAGTRRPKCIAVDIGDVNRPIIKSYLLDVSDDMNKKGVADTDGYIDEDGSAYAFVSNDGDPTSSGYLKINSEIWPYQYFTFGIETDEPSQCKISQTVPESYEQMDQYFPDSYFDYQHNQSWILVPDTLYNFYIVCQDHNGNGVSPPTFFEVEVQTDEGEDVTPPSIEATSLRNGAYVPAGVNETALSIYLDGVVSGCRWSSVDQEYTLMEFPFICPGVPDSASAYFEDDCSTVLNVTQENNYYYFACMDQDGNYNTENYPFTLIATGPLFIDSVSPSGTLYTDYTTLAVQTSGGPESGKAVCSYDGVEFFATNASYHQQSLEDLATGFYDYDIFCQDVAGNQNISNINFTIEVDLVGPELSSIYKQDTTVYFALDEVANCEYYFEDFDYGSGTDISSSSISGSFPLTEVKEYYLACEDIFGNQGSWTVQV